ncbi:hypothetical protein BHE74_00029151 [Ensete ventricosum]|nr:hypothetical protein GW17_00033423 [Ensete ventricosum]RWW63656.1 hypothetical protein BHE74_00029151 [Ensete ventricosum]
MSHEYQAFTGSPLVQARNFAVMAGANAGISSVMKRIRGVEDVQSSASRVDQAARFSDDFFCFMLQVGQKFSTPPDEDVYYSQTRGMLTSLGLQKYEKNFKKGLLTDSTLPLLTDR